MNYTYEYENQFKKAIVSFPQQNQKQLQNLKSLLIKRLQIENEYAKKCQQIKNKYENMFKSNYDLRNSIIKGTTPLLQIKSCISGVDFNFDTTVREEEVGIPQYWFKCL
ncbi:MAG: NAP domain-containing protein, partial [archaeon]|nr:NAP domain-containing protein [archaeon]